MIPSKPNELTIPPKPSELKRILYFVQMKGFEAAMRTPKQGTDRCLFFLSFLFLCQKVMRRMVKDNNH